MVDFLTGHVDLGVVGETVEEIVVAAFFFDYGCGGVGVYADDFVEMLSVAAFFDAGHDDVFGGHEGEFCHEMSLDDFGVNGGVFHDIEVKVEDSVGGEKCFGEADAAYGGVIEGAFEPLGGSGEL